MTVRLSGAIVAAAILALAAPAVAGADVSSLDAYAGQAAVLGKPHHKHHHHDGPTAGQRGSRTGVGHGALALAGKPPGSATSSHAGGSAGSTAIDSGSPSGRASGSAGAAASGNGAGGASAEAGASARGSTSAPSGESGLARGVRNAIPASSSSSLTGLDVAVLCAVALMLLGTGLLIRRSSRQPR
jgi:hypothetical protein